MLVRDLIAKLETYPQDASVYVNCIFGESVDLPIRSVLSSNGTERVIIQDHITEIKPREFTSHDGQMYDVPWGGTIRR